MNIIIPWREKKAAAAFNRQNFSEIACHEFQEALLLGLEAGRNTVQDYRASREVSAELRTAQTI